MTNKNAFTLVELMISIALVLVLIIGVNRVFKYTTDTVGTQAAVSSAMRDLRGAERTLRHDMDAMVSSSEQPAIVIRSHVVYAFRNQQDALADSDGLPNTDVDPTAPAGSPEIDYSAAGNEGLQTFRRHRLDTISFFTRDISQPYKRQTGDIGSATLIFNSSSSEAWVSLGPLWLPDNSGTFTPGVGTAPPPTYPGVGTMLSSNPNNFYASQFLFGRQTILMKKFANMSIGETYLSAAGPTLAPFGYNSVVFRKTSATGNAAVTPAPLIQEARCDMADTTISDYRTVVAGGAAASWWAALATTGTGGGDPQYLFQADPAGVKQAGGMTSDSAAKASSVFIGSCSQFIVEFAGDFVTQDAGGVQTSAVPDGITDFVVIPLTGGIPERRMIRWYGAPRDTSGSAVGGPDGTITPPSGDVATLATNYGVNPQKFSFEKQNYAANTDYIVAWRAGDFDGTDAAYNTADDKKPRKPTMIRIIVQIADSAGRLTDGQNFEYVFAVK